MALVLERKPRANARPRLAGSDGGAPDPPPLPPPPPHRPRREWPLVLAVLVAVLLAAVLTWLGMYTQIQANLTGAQLPGA